MKRVLSVVLVLGAFFAAGLYAQEQKTEKKENKQKIEKKEHKHEHKTETKEHKHEGESGEHKHEGESEEHRHTEHLPSQVRGEHAREGGEGHNEEGEESGQEFGLNETYDMTRNGARLILKYDKKSNYFVGSVMNTTKKTLEKVRVEVHLSNGIELGPTTPANLAAGKKMSIKLKGSEKKFEKWGAHPEVGNEEGHSHEGESGHKHEGEHK